MKRSRFAATLALLALSAAACSERTGSPAEVGGAASLSFAPRFASFGGLQSSGPINFIRLTARSVATNAIVATLDTTVNPTDTEWEIDLQVPPDVGQVRVLVELINKVGAVETIEWSGLTAVIDVQPGSAAPAQVTLYKGPPGNINVTQVTATPDVLTIPEGSGGRFTATALPSGVVFWSSLDPLIATVDANGTVTTLRNGSARIVAEAGPRADTVVVNVTQVVTAVVASPDSAQLTSIGAETAFNAVARDIRGGDVAGAGISWAIVSGSTIVQDLGNGHFRALANGRAEVRASSVANPAVGDNVIITVAQRGARLTLAPTSIALNTVGATRQFTATVQDANGNPMSAAIAWRTADAAVATIDANGLATARASGSTEVIAVLNAGSPDSVVARAALSVAQEIRTLVLSPSGATLEAIGATAQFSAEARDAGGSIVNNALISWSVNGTAATVTEAGLVTATAPGNATLIAAAGGARATAAIVVKQRVATLTIAPTLDSIAVGATTTLVATANDSRGALIANAALTWTSSNPTVATVDASGVVTGHAAGNAIITAGGDGVTATATVVVTGTSVETGESVWSGTVGTAWENAANWSPAVLPDSNSNVRIPAGRPNYPVLSSTRSIAQLTQEAGTTLTIGTGFILKVYGSLIDVNVAGAGRVELQPAIVEGSVVDQNLTTPALATVNGTVFNLDVLSTVQLNGDFRSNGFSRILVGGALYVGPYLYRVDGNLLVGGILDMTDPGARVVVGLNAQFGGSTSMIGHLTAGELHLLGNLTTFAPNSFPASGTHLTVFGNANPAQAAMNSGAGVYFNNVRIEKPNLFTFTTPVKINGSVVVAAVTPEVLNTSNITIGGNLELLGTTFWHVQSTTFTGDPIFPAEMLYGVTFTGDARLRQNTAIGGLAISGNGNLDLNGYDLTVGGTFYTTDNGTIEMHAGETLDIGANASFDGGSTAGKLEDGRINFRGPFTALRAQAFAAPAIDDGPTITAWFMGSDPQTITMNNADATTGNHFGDLKIVNDDGVTLATDIVVLGKLEMDELAPLVGPAQTLTIAGDIVDNASCDCESNVQPSTVAGVATVALAPGLSAATSTQMNYHVAATALIGTHQRLPDVIETDIRVLSNLTLAGVVYVNGNFQVLGNLRLGGDTGFDCPGTYLLVQENFYTVDTGTLEMLCSHDAFLTLDVDGDVYFAGGSETGRLKNGRIEVGGNFHAGGSTTTGFVSEGTALWLAPYADAGVQQIFLGHPAQQTLADVLIRRAGQTGDIDIDFVNGAHVFGHFRVDSAGGAFVNLKSSNNATLYVRGIDTCNDQCWYGSFQLYHARIDRLPVVTEHVEIYTQYLTFGTFLTNVDQLTIVDVQHSPYFDSITFETVPAAGFYHMHASEPSANIIVNNPTPATAAGGARWRAENGAHIIWGHEPNFRLNSLSVPSSVTIGQTFNISGFVANDGAVAAGAFNLQIRVLDAATGVPVANVPVINLPIAGAPGGGFVPISQGVTVAAAPGIVWPAAIKVEIVMDSGNTVAETNESDNTFITNAITVLAPPSNITDARISAATPARR